jgi:hypothetical protein
VTNRRGSRLEVLNRMHTRSLSRWQKTNEYRFNSSALEVAASLERHKHLERARGMRLAWAEGIPTLHKYKGIAADAGEQVRNIIENSRIYLSQPDQLNDPLDCAPVFALARSLDDPAFVQQLRDEEDRMNTERGTTSSTVTAASP